MEKLTLIDTTTLFWIVCYNTQKNEPDNFKYAKKQLDDFFTKIFIETQADYYLAFTDGYTNFRKLLYPMFKANRVSRRPQFFSDLKEYAINKYNIYYNELLESDDLITYHANLLKDKYDITICSIDSDIKQFPAKYYWNSIFTEIDLETANFNFLIALLIKGHNNKLDYLEGCGPESARTYIYKALKDENEVLLVSKWKMLLDAYIYGINKQDYPVKRNIEGYGLLKGIQKFTDSFKQTYLLRNKKDIDDVITILKNEIKLSEDEILKLKEIKEVIKIRKEVREEDEDKF